MSFTDNTRDEVTLIGWKHKYLMYSALLLSDRISYDTMMIVRAELMWIQKSFEEVRERNALNKQAGTYEAVAEQCEEFFKSIAAAEPAQVG